MTDFKKDWIDRCAIRLESRGGVGRDEAVRIARDCFDNRIHPEDLPDDAADNEIALLIRG